MESVDLSPFATTADLQAALVTQNEATETAAQQAQQMSEAVSQLGGRMESVEGDLGRLAEQVEELQVRWRKVYIIHAHVHV